MHNSLITWKGTAIFYELNHLKSIFSAIIIICYTDSRIDPRYLYYMIKELAAVKQESESLQFIPTKKEVPKIQVTLEGQNIEGTNQKLSVWTKL